MKYIFKPGTYPITVNYALLVLRIGVGLLMLTHGLDKLNTLMGSESITFPDPIGVGATASLALTVFAELVCSVFLFLGFATRFAAIPLLITMLVAVFIIHAEDPFNKMELPLLYATIYLVMVFTGAGKISIDRLIYKKKR